MSSYEDGKPKSLRTMIALIEQKSGFVDEKLSFIISEMAQVKKSLSDTEILKKKDLNDHVLQDRWLFGFVAMLLIFILGKLIVG